MKLPVKIKATDYSDYREFVAEVDYQMTSRMSHSTLAQGGSIEEVALTNVARDLQYGLFKEVIERLDQIIAEVRESPRMEASRFLGDLTEMRGEIRNMKLDIREVPSKVWENKIQDMRKLHPFPDRMEIPPFAGIGDAPLDKVLGNPSDIRKVLWDNILDGM